MFVEQSTVKLWRVRSAFILLCVVPTLCLSYWAGVRQSEVHREHIADKASRLLGMRVSIESMTYPQPGCLTLTDVTVAGQSFSGVSVVTSGNEVRVAVDDFVPSEETAVCVVGLVSRWLSEPVQFNKNYVIDVNSFSWQSSDSAEDKDVWPLRVECVSAGSGRAIRFFNRDSTQDEIRIVRTSNLNESGEHPKGDVNEVEVNASGPIPVPFINAVLSECGSSQWQFGEKATFTGQVHILNKDDDWTAECVGRLKQIDLAAMTSLLPSRLQGDGEITLNRFVWSQNRMELCDCVCVADRGEVEQVWIDRLVTLMGCRVEDAYHQLSGSQVRSFQRLGFGLVIDSGGLRLRALPGRSGCLLESQGLPVILEPTGTATLDRLAWLLSGTTPPAVPGTDVTAWLLSVLPKTRTIR